MLLTRIRIQGFRGLADVELTLGEKTVLIGENNAGKTSMLDALRFALRSTPGRRTSPPDELDFAVGAKATREFRVFLYFQPLLVDEIQQLAEVALPDDTGGYFLCLRYTASLSLGRIEEAWDFLNSDGDALRPGTSADTLRRRLQQLVPLFQLEAVRDAGEQFSSRSSLWASLLRDVEISENERIGLEAELRSLNQKVLDKAPKLQRASNTISELHSVLPRKDTQSVSVQALSPRLWDLLSRSQIVVGSSPINSAASPELELPLRRHGQGAQSLAVLFLFKAYFEQLGNDREPLLTVEEPESHLHPQAARSLWQRIAQIPGQVIVTSHSPYFVQNVPLEQLRVAHRKNDVTEVRFVEAEFVEEIELKWPSGSLPGLSYEEKRLTVTQAIDDDTFRKLAKENPAQATILRQLQRRSSFILASEDVRALDSAARHMRGEMFFSRVWLLCEGDSDRQFLKLAFEGAGIDPDQEGICIIDFKVGIAGQSAFGSLARALGYPVFLFCDDDQSGKGYQKSFKKAADVDDGHIFVAAPDLEHYLLKSPAGPQVRDAASRLGCEVSEPDATLAGCLHENNTRFIQALREVLPESKLPMESKLIEFLEKVAGRDGG